MRLSETKIVSLESLAEVMELQRCLGRKVVMTNGCFDILHAGHAAYLQKARSLGDALMVGVNGDRSVRELKGKGRPINKERERALLLASLESVDYVMIFSELRATSLLLMIKPDIWAKGGDYTLETLDVEEVSAVKSYGGQIMILPKLKSISTTGLIDQLQRASQP